MRPGTKLHAPVTIERLREMLRYDPDSGKLFWLITAARFTARAGSCAGSTRTDGYRMIIIKTKRCMEHRVAWALFHGEWPTMWIDHINGVKSDNRITNLRAATYLQNRWNAKAHKTNTTGHKGVTRSRGKFLAQIQIDGKNKNLGRHQTAEEAAAAYRAACVSLHGDYAWEGLARSGHSHTESIP